MRELSYEELQYINGGGLVGSIFGGIWGFVIGCITGAAATTYYGDTSSKTFVKHIYTGTLFGAGLGSVVSGPF